MMILLAFGLLLTAFLGYRYISKRLPVSAGNAGDVPASGDAQVVNVGGINFVTKPSSYDQGALGDMTKFGFDSNGNRITTVPPAYDVNNPTTAARRVEAIDRAVKVDQIAASEGYSSADAMYQGHLAESVAATRDDYLSGGFDYAAVQARTDQLVAAGVAPSVAASLATAPTEARKGRGHL